MVDLVVFVLLTSIVSRERPIFTCIFLFIINYYKEEKVKTIKKNFYLRLEFARITIYHFDQVK